MNTADSSKAAPAARAGALDSQSVREVRRAAAADRGGDARAGGAIGTGLSVSPQVKAAGEADDDSVGGAGSEAAGDPNSTPGSGAGHPRGKGHEKSLPAAAQHGQQTAAAHKGTSRGASAGKGGDAAQPVKPSQADAPAGSGAGKAPSKAPPAVEEPRPSEPEHAAPEKAGDGSSGRAPTP